MFQFTVAGVGDVCRYSRNNILLQKKRSASKTLKLRLYPRWLPLMVPGALEAKTIQRNSMELMLPRFSLTRFTIQGLVSIGASLVHVVLAPSWFIK